ncbi:single Ig IL-1-related receptor isoform X2 [Nothobranchius furzeri]|uniref:Single immunoglobulin and toll-interleukin 1 receptor (TIR) domain n=1 Tax=Nothobranchius furzeri TaxID=105023 RepID=A0A8C6Q484_NOTFU|nr:single Ig IL-1-related receptor isoform X2 [Nothobranchius furzeri]KAF7224261.1 transcript variant X2 [Nothobranchius furzeri]
MVCVASSGLNLHQTKGQSCVDEGRFKEHVLYAGQQEPSYILKCPLQPALSQSVPEIQLTWLKDCQQLQKQVGKNFLEFTSVSIKDEGNYTCMQEGNGTALFTVRLKVKDSRCSQAPVFKTNGGPTKLWRKTGSSVVLNCTALLLWDPSEDRCETTLLWSKAGQSLTNHTGLFHNTSSWSPANGQLIVSSLLEITFIEPEDFGLYSCTSRNLSSYFSIQNSSSPSHTAAVSAAITLLLLLGVAALVYTRCHLNFKLWYKNSYGDFELNDGKLYDAYISYVNNDYDRKFINFILKPHLENKSGYKVHLNENEILPGSEPSAELLVNMSRSRRLIVLLSHAYLQQDWCTMNFRQGLLHLLELCQQPILIMLEGQPRCMNQEVREQLAEHQHRLTILTWRQNSVTPSSVFWKELALAMPRRVVLRNESAGDPQTVLQDDKDPMLTLDPDYLDCRSDIDPAGDLGLRLPVYRSLSAKAPILPAAEPNPDIDVSDLGSRSYAARCDFYCLVTKEDV